MARVFTQKTLQEFLANGGSPESLPAGAVLTPSARDLLGSLRSGQGSQGGSAVAAASAATAAVLRSQRGHAEPAAALRSQSEGEFKWTPGSDAKGAEAIAAFFNSPQIHALKERMCEMGHRMWAKDYADGNGGELTVRVGDNLVLCTPALVSKGFMTPADICLIDLEGNQLAGSRKYAQEAMTHLAIMKRQPKARACCHAHPPHATAFALAKVKPPTCLVPQAEVFLGAIAMVAYATPGSAESAQIVAEAAVDSQAVLMQNHGVITWGNDVEDAYGKMESTDAYCRTVWVASQLGKELTPIEPSQAKELIQMRKSLGMEDKREDLKECELCDNSEFRPGFISYSNPSGTRDSGAAVSFNDKAEEVVRAITDRIMASYQS